MITFNDLDCYLIHYTRAIDRNKFMTDQFKKYNITSRVKWIEKHDQEDITYMDYSVNFTSKIGNFNSRIPPSMKGVLEDFYFKPSEVSCALKHKQAMIDFVNTKNKYYFVMEDDIIFEDNFIEKLNGYFESLPDDWDALFIGSGGGKRIDESLISPGKYWYYKEYPKDRCTDSIIMKRKTVKSILSNLNTYGLAFPFDHEITFWLELDSSNVYWLEPPLIKQGSQCGVFKSLLGNAENLV